MLNERQVKKYVEKNAPDGIYYQIDGVQGERFIQLGFLIGEVVVQSLNQKNLILSWHNKSLHNYWVKSERANITGLGDDETYSVIDNLIKQLVFDGDAPMVVKKQLGRLLDLSTIWYREGAKRNWDIHNDRVCNEDEIFLAKREWLLDGKIYLGDYKSTKIDGDAYVDEERNVIGVWCYVPTFDGEPTICKLEKPLQDEK